LGKRPHVTIFGSDYDTPDGTGVRDYIHIMDLASGHVAALKKLETTPNLQFKVYNLGTGRPASVLDLIHAFRLVSGKDVPYVLEGRREGDIVRMYGNPHLALTALGWAAQYSLQQMCEDFWRWQTMNPNGYKGEVAETKQNGVNGTH